MNSPEEQAAASGISDAPPTVPRTVIEAARMVILTSDANQKAYASRRAAALWRDGKLSLDDRAGSPPMPERPARPARPVLIDPSRMPKRRTRGIAGRIALLHALAHIELNAIDLAWDIVGRFAMDTGDPETFVTDWTRVAEDEARHFLMINGRLSDFDARYGDLPAHDGLWESAHLTSHDLTARLAVVPMVLEARGLDVTPQMIARLTAHGDDASATLLQTVFDDEITHVAAGTRWFRRLCADRGVDPNETWRSLVSRYFRGSLRPPFNDEARAEAGLPRDWYEPRSPQIATSLASFPFGLAPNRSA